MFSFLRKRTTAADLIQGFIAGAVLACFSANLLINAEVHRTQTTVNGWITTLKCGKVGNGILLRAACAMDVAALSVPEEEVYWQTFVDDAGHKTRVIS
ncbi:MAG: hypothetical protein WB762_14510 [Candidatus Sulfotelmatobacter sp.]